MIQALQNSADYIMYSDKRDGMLFTPEMSRRARAIDLWATIKYLGQIGIDRMINGFHERAQQFAKELKRAGFVVVNDVVFNQVMIQIGNQVETDKFVAAVQNSGKAWVGGSSWFGQPVVRISVCSWATTSNDVTASVETFAAALK
jgi:glutamate/tyrosine decarboxylase-like PLP-dependent enzyme